MLDATEYQIILSLYDNGNSIRKINELLGYSRNTIRKVLKEQSPHPFNTPQRKSILDDYKDYLQMRFEETDLSATKLYEEIIPMGYEGSVDRIRVFLKTLSKPKISKEENQEDNSTSFKFHILTKDMDCHIWMHSLLQGKIGINQLESTLPIDKNLLYILYSWVLKKRIKYRNRAMAILAHYRQFPKRAIARFLCIRPRRVRDYIQRFESGGIDALLSEQKRG